MSVKVEQFPADRHPPGTAALKISGASVAALGEAERCEIAIIKVGAADQFLDPRDVDQPWKTALWFFRPQGARLEGAALWLELDHGVTFHLPPDLPFKLRLRGADGRTVDEIFSLPRQLRRPSRKPTGWTPPAEPQGPADGAADGVADGAAPTARPTSEAAFAAPRADEVPPAAPAAAPQPSPPPAAAPQSGSAPSGGRSKAPWIAAVAVAGVALAIGLWWLAGPGASTSASTLTMDSCRAKVSAGLEPAAARAEAEALARGGRLLDCQLLLLKHAASGKDTVAARLLGGFYDPDTWSKETSPLPAPNPGEAARWHKLAADAGDRESLYRYGMLLKLGRTDEADGPEKAQAYLQRALDAGHPLAQAALAR